MLKPFRALPIAAVCLFWLVSLGSAVAVAQNNPNGAAGPATSPGFSSIAAATTKGSGSKHQLIPLRMPGEFEPQRAIMLSISDWAPHHYDILAEIAAATAGHIELLIFYGDNAQLQEVVHHLDQAQVPGDHIAFSPIKLDTIWLRDFGPRIGASQLGPIAIDFFYEGSRPLDDGFPRRWAEASRTRLRTVRWTVQGGNLMFNGQGIGVTSERVFQDNAIQFPPQSRPQNPRAEARKIVTNEFKRACNLSQLVVLEPLHREITRHVDMFMTFVAADHAVVGWLETQQDPINAGVLNRNAQRLSKLRVGNKPMRVSRIRMPVPRDQQWSSFTNVILANDLVLLPTFDSDPPELVAAARRTYETVLPGVTVKTINLDSMKALQGSLHCLSMSLPEFAPWPKTRYEYSALRDQLTR